MKLIPGRILIHKKNKFYIYLDHGRFSEDSLQEFVIYKALYENDYPYGQIWIRPIEMFTKDRFRPLTIKESFFYFLGLKNRIKF